MTMTLARAIDRRAALRLLERTDRHNGYTGVGKPNGSPSPLIVALTCLDNCTKFQLRPSLLPDFHVLEMWWRDQGWVSFFVYTAKGAPQRAEWP